MKIFFLSQCVCVYVHTKLEAKQQQKKTLGTNLTIIPASYILMKRKNRKIEKFPVFKHQKQRENEMGKTFFHSQHTCTQARQTETGINLFVFFSFFSKIFSPLIFHNSGYRCCCCCFFPPIQWQKWEKKSVMAGSLKHEFQR